MRLPSSLRLALISVPKNMLERGGISVNACVCDCRGKILEEFFEQRDPCGQRLLQPRIAQTAALTSPPLAQNPTRAASVSPYSESAAIGNSHAQLSQFPK